MLKIGHRGAPGYPRVAENTLGSFRRAIWKGANALEFDVRRTKDGKLVVVHDLSVQRTTNGFGNVCDMTYEQLHELDAGLGERVPLLEDVLKLFGTEVLLNIEIKERGVEREILRLVEFYKLNNRVLISAFDSDDNDKDSNSSWKQLEFFFERIPIALLATEPKLYRIGLGQYIKEAARMKAFAIHPDLDAVCASMVILAHDEGLLVNAWTANSSSTIKRLQEMGIDGIFSDFPERL